MIGDLAKVLAYGYVGSKVGKAVEKRMDERQRERDEAIQELKKFAFVIYDGKAPQSCPALIFFPILPPKTSPSTWGSWDIRPVPSTRRRTTAVWRALRQMSIASGSS